MMACMAFFRSSNPTEDDDYGYFHKDETKKSKPQDNGDVTIDDLRDIVSHHWSRPKRLYDEICPGIFIGKETTARDVNKLEKLGITHILNAACLEINTGELFYYTNDFKCSYMGVPAMDIMSFRMLDYFDEASYFIHQALKIPKQKVYVHCREGISRSATLVIVYLMKYRNMTAYEAIRFVRKRRNIYPNYGFLDQILTLDKQLRATKLRQIK